MPNMPPASTADIVPLDAARQRRRYINLANAHEAWQEIKASWALEGIEVTDDNAMQAGRMIAGDITYEQLVNDLRAKYGRQTSSDSAEHHRTLLPSTFTMVPISSDTVASASTSF